MPASESVRRKVQKTSGEDRMPTPVTDTLPT